MNNGNGRTRKKDSAKLVWDSKPRRAPNPKDIEFQTAEVVIPNPQVAGQLPLSFKDGLFGEKEIDKQKMNRLIWGDNLLAMQALLAQGYEGKIDLIYIDPPFDSKADYSHNLQIEGSEVTKEPSVIERLAYKDTWSGGTDSYLDMLYPRIQLMKRLLSNNGSIYVHCDFHVGHYIKIVMDEIFGKSSFQREIIWRIGWISGYKSAAKNWIRNHDSILFYVKTPDNFIFNKEYIPYPPEYVRRDGSAPQGQGYPIEDTWNCSDLDVMDSIQIMSFCGEKTGYFTQKNQNLIARIVRASTNVGDLVADFFAGSGTTGAVAEKLGRRWIMCELGKVGIQVTRARLVEQGAKPFLIENIGNYQREMIYLTGGKIWEMQQLILKLYGATPRDKTSGLGVRKTDDGLELVYVGYPDRPVTARKAEELAIQAQKLDGAGYKRLVILGWDYEYNYRQSLESRLNAAKNKLGVKIESRDIPPDIYDYLKKAKTEDDIEGLAEKIFFYERPYLRLEKPGVKELADKRVQITITLKHYVLQKIPISRSTAKGQADYEALLKLIKDNFAVLIDYWAIDWDYDGFNFKSQWQAFRGNGKKAKIVPIEATEVLDKRTKRTIAIRVVDIFGNDAGAIIEV